MFLNRLNNKEKVAFLELAHHIARSDGDFSVEEQEVINTYCFEMAIDNIEYNENNFDLQKILSIFKNDMSQKVLLLELMALIYSDNRVDSNEEKVLNSIVQYFNIDIFLVQIYAEWTKSILAVSAQGELLLEL